jgi:hypothetical protein
MNAASPSKEIHHEPHHPWSISKGANRGALHHGRPIIILFDSRASHEFMSPTYAMKAKLSLVPSGMPYVISTPRGRVDPDRIVCKAQLDLDG